MCLPGIKIEDVESRIEGLIRTRAEEGMVCIVQVGTNNLQKDSIGEIKRRNMRSCLFISRVGEMLGW